MKMYKLNNVSKQITKFIKLLVFVSLVFMIIFSGLNLVFPFKFHVNYSSIVTDRNNVVIHAFLSNEDKWRMYSELKEISPSLKKAIIFKEDKYFYYHPGINLISIIRALKNNLIQQKRTSGASTIDMQVVRLLEPKKRTYQNKIIEMFRALQLEVNYSKDEILQLYLNLVPYGGNIEGIKAASLLYFGKSPNHLSPAEIASLAIIPNRPNSLKPGTNNQKLINERNKWLKRLRPSKIWSNEIIDDAIEESLSMYRREAPKYAPHFSYRIKNKFPDKSIIHSTLSLETQRKTEKLLSDYARKLYLVNTKNAAVFIIDNKTHSIVSYIGSSDFNNIETSGQVDGVRAIRSPGSTLKPLLYGLAFDKGIITPKTIIEDLPVNYNGYEPENYNNKFNGQVSVEFALINSLNVPAVNLLNEISTDKIINKLEDCGFYQIKKDKDKLGLSLILGGCGVNLEQLCNLFSCFANSGMYIPAHYIISDTLTISKKILSKPSAFMLSDILSKLTRPNMQFQWQNSNSLPPIAWKTGTSYGRRDAWSIGYNNDYIVGVWAGNFDGTSIPLLSGARIATPLMFKIFNSIDKNSESAWNIAPDSIDFRLVCSKSGRVPSSFCKNQVIDYYIPELSNTIRCEHMKYIFIAADSSISYCSSCLPATNYIKVLYPNYSPQMINYLETNHIKYKTIPPHNPNCEKIFIKNAPQIISPIDQAVYYLDKDESMQMKLSCYANDDVNKIYWYINDVFYKSAGAGKGIFVQPPKGKVKISCSDDKGRNSDIVISVRYIDY